MNKLKIKNRFNATVYASVSVTMHDIEADTAEQAAAMAETAVYANPNEWFATKLGKVEVPGCGTHNISDVQFTEEVTAVMIDHLDEFPLVEFCVPGPENIVNDRPAVWAFVKEGLLTVGQRESLGRKLLRF